MKPDRKPAEKTGPTCCRLVFFIRHAGTAGALEKIRARDPAAGWLLNLDLPEAGSRVSVEQVGQPVILQH